MESFELKNGVIVTQNDRRDILRGSVRVEGGRITHIGRGVPPADVEIDCTDSLVIPGFIQTHVHLNQALFRSLADDLSLIDWLMRRLYPLEAAHTRDSVYWSARLSCEEMLSGGTTCIADMGSAIAPEACFAALRDSGMRGCSGKMLMDLADEAPASLVGEAESLIRTSLSLMKEWGGTCGGRLRYLFAPRFALSCSDELLRSVACLAKEHGVLVHTHASENRDEVQAVKGRTGMDNVEYLDSLGLLSPQLLLAHCIWVSDREISLLSRRGVNVLHCPTANLKLASGVAPVHRMMASGVGVSLGSDGAPCNNTHDMFQEMRCAALIHKVRDYDPTVLPAQQVLDMATRHGAAALGLAGLAGQIVPGAYADLTVVDTQAAHLCPFSHPVSMLVYAAGAADVSLTLVDGRIRYERGSDGDGKKELFMRASREQERLVARSDMPYLSR